MTVSFPRRRAVFRIHGMDCAEEVSLLRRSLSEVPGITELHFDVMQARMDVEYDPARVTPDDIGREVARLGMSAEPWAEPPRTAAWKDQWPDWQTLVSGLFLLAGTILRVAAEGGGWRAWVSEESHSQPPVVLACYLLAIAAGFFPFVPKVWVSVRHRRPDLNILVALSLAGAGFLGEWSEAAALSFLFALAGRIERWSLARARHAVASLFEMSPRHATVIHAHGDHVLPVERVPVGALVRVRPGEQIPCDGEVLAGESTVNQAILTGESVAVPKAVGSRVYAGTLNMGGMLEIRAASPASDTTMARILRMLGESARRKSPSERTVERFARMYTPAVLALALLVMAGPPLLAGGAWERWLHEGMVILLIACPCALVISTPVTVAAALASAARRGVLVKGGAFLEELAAVRVVAFEKNGVLTLGCPGENDDPLRAETAQAVRELKAAGVLRVAMLTGDATEAAREAAAAANVDEIHAELTPEARVEVVKALSEGGFKVAVVGDGVNDVLALAAANVGIAFGRHAMDAALETADVVILSDDLLRLPFAIRHARRAVGLIRQNVAIAVGLKLAFLVVAVTGRATLWMALIADMGATLLVVFNGLRMLWAKR